jgi:hypothetical protein
MGQKLMRPAGGSQRAAEALAALDRWPPGYSPSLMNKIGSEIALVFD